MEANRVGRRSGIAAVVTVALWALVVPVGVANAAPVDDDVDALLSVVDTTASEVTEVAAGDGLGDVAELGEVEIVLADDSGATVFVEPEPEEERGAGPTIYSVIESHAESEQSFDFVVDGQPAELEAILIGESEFIEVRSAVTGEVVNLVLPAWAEDAEGNDVATEYEVVDGTLTQTVDTEGAVFPVVADPALACNWIHCTVQYNKAETSRNATWGPVGAAALTGACAWLAGKAGGWVCVTYGTWFVSAAIEARRVGKCIGLQWMHTTRFTYPYIYSGGNCR